MSDIVLYFQGMTPYSIDLRRRIVESVGKGHSKTDTALRFKVSWKSVYRYCKAAELGGLAPKPQGGSAKKVADERLMREVEARPSATLKRHAKALGVSHVAVWRRLRQLGVTLKNSRDTGRGAITGGGCSSGSCAGSPPCA